VKSTVFVAVMAALLSVPALAKNDKDANGAESSAARPAKNVARGEQLPPGWQKKLNRVQRLEPDLYRLAEPVPDYLRLTLPVGKLGSVDVRLEGKIVRLDRATHEILNVFDIR
jgi:hypothetical protein